MWQAFEETAPAYSGNTEIIRHSERRKQGKRSARDISQHSEEYHGDQYNADKQRRIKKGIGPITFLIWAEEGCQRRMQ